jgi:hypothetical protein
LLKYGENAFGEGRCRAESPAIVELGGQRFPGEVADLVAESRLHVGEQ